MRSLIQITGSDKKKFLQGLITNDINNLLPVNSSNNLANFIDNLASDVVDNLTDKTQLNYLIPNPNTLSLRERTEIKDFSDTIPYLKVGNGMIYSLMLNSQGRFLYDFFIFEKDDKIYLDCFDFRRDEIVKKLNFYKLRSQVEIEKNDDFELGFLVEKTDQTMANQSQKTAEGNSIKNIYQELENRFRNQTISEEIFIFNDPRNNKMPKRVYLAKKNIAELKKILSEFSDKFSFIDQVNSQENSLYDFIRVSLKIAEGEKDLTQEKSLILEYGFDSLSAISYQKGCYVGQELTARTHYLGEIRKKLFHIKITNLEKIEKNSEIFSSEKKVGEVLSSVFFNNQLNALALIKNSDDLDLTSLILADKSEAKISIIS